MTLDDRDPTPDRRPYYPVLGEWGAEPEGDEIPVATPAAVFCRRCGETAAPVAGCCRWCGARLVGKRPRATPVYEIDEDESEDDWHADWRDEDSRRPAKDRPLIPPLVVVFVSYAMLLGSLVLLVIVAIALSAKTESDLCASLAVVELLDAVLTVGALALVWKQAKQKLPRGTAGLTWVAAFPALAMLLCLNIAFITFLRELLRPFGVADAPRMEVTFATVMLICVQPAIVEELFFRQMTLGVFRKSMNLHLAIWLTAAMFAFAHLGQILAMPYLFLVGGVLGYARAWGGLPLAMLMHFIHNFAVIAYSAWQ